MCIQGKSRCVQHSKMHSVLHIFQLLYIGQSYSSEQNQYYNSMYCTMRIINSCSLTKAFKHFIE